MLKRLFNKILLHIKENFAYYGISTAALFCGAVLAVVCAFSLPEFNGKELALYFEDFFAGFLKTGADSKLIMLSALKINVAIFCLLYLFSVMIIGTPFIVLCGVSIGFAFSFAVTFVFKIYGISALLLILTAIIPHIIITLPCYIALIVLCLKFGIQLKKDKGSTTNQILRFSFCLLIIFALCLSGALMQAYIEPVFIQLVAKYFI